MCNGSFFLISVDRGTHQCALETRLSQLVVLLVEVLLRKDLLRALLGSLGAGLIDLLGPLPCGGDQTHFAIQHAQQPAHAGGAAALTLGIHDMGFAHAQRGAVIPVFGKDGQIAVNGAADDALGLPVKGAAVRRDHRQMKGRHGLPFLRFCEHVIDGAREQECALGQLVALAVQDHLEAAQGLLERHILAGHTGELLCHVEALAQEALHLAGAADRALVFLAQLVHAHDGNDVLQLLVALQHLLDGAGDLVVLLTHDLRAEDAAGGIQRVHSGIDALRSNVTAQDRGGIQMGKGGRFVQNFVADFAAELVQIVHDASKKAYMFYDDSWVGSEPYSESFARIGFDGIIKCVFSAYEARMCADVPGVETHELRLHPYLFPTGLTGEPVFAAGGDPVTPAKQYWTAVRRALLRRCADRIGLGGYLHLTQNFPDFCDYIETLADEFRKIKALHRGGASYALPVKISVLTHWGKLRSWTCGGHYHEHPDLDLINLLESVAGLPVQTEFIDFAQLKNGDFTGNVLLVAGLKNSAYGGGSEWNDVKTYESAAKFVHGGGALICVNEASETDGFSTNLRLAPLLGIDLDRGDFNCRGKYPAAAEREEISVGTFTGKKEAFIFAPDVRILKNAEARAGEEKTFAVAARHVGKGYATYVSSYKHTPENAAALLSLLLRLRNLSAAENYLSDNPYVDCAYFEKEKKLALANVSGISQSARISLPGGGKTFTLPPAGIKIVPVGKIRAEEKEE